MRISEEDGLRDNIAWFLDYLQGERGASPHTVAAYERDLMQASAFFAGRALCAWQNIGPAQTADFRGFLGSRGLAQSTIQRKTAALRSFLRFLSKNGKYEGKLPDTGGLRKGRALPKALTAEEVERIFSQPEIATPAGLRDRAMMELLYGGGLRITELVELRTEHYSADESLLRVFGKRGKTRIVPLPSGTHEWLRKYLEEARPGLVKKACPDVFLNQRGGRISRSGVFRILQAHARSAGITSAIGPHTLRHTYAVHLVQAGADLRSVQELLGHASIATTEVYTHLDMETVRRKYREAHPRAK